MDKLLNNHLGYSSILIFLAEFAIEIRHMNKSSNDGVTKNRITLQLSLEDDSLAKFILPELP